MSGPVVTIRASTFDNVDLRYRLMPAVEYSVYPYRDATRRQVTIAYRVGGSHIAYQDTTICDETEQLLPEHTLSAGYEVTQPWGQVDVGVNASQYLHEPERYSVRFGGVVDVRRPGSSSGCATASARSTTTSSTRASKEDPARISSDPPGQMSRPSVHQQRSAAGG